MHELSLLFGVCLNGGINCRILTRLIGAQDETRTRTDYSSEGF